MSQCVDFDQPWHCRSGPQGTSLGMRRNLDDRAVRLSRSQLDPTFPTRSGGVTKDDSRKEREKARQTVACPGKPPNQRSKPKRPDKVPLYPLPQRFGLRCPFSPASRTPGYEANIPATAELSGFRRSPELNASNGAVGRRCVRRRPCQRWSGTLQRRIGTSWRCWPSEAGGGESDVDSLRGCRLQFPLLCGSTGQNTCPMC